MSVLSDLIDKVNGSYHSENVPLCSKFYRKSTILSLLICTFANKENEYGKRG